MTYSDESILVAALSLHVVLLHNLIAFVQSSTAPKSSRSHVVVVIIFVVFVTPSHGRLGSCATLGLAV